MLEDLRRPVIGRDQDIGKRLVVAQQHVEARPQPLDQIGFEQQRFGLGAGDDEFKRAGRRDHPLDAGVETGGTGVGANAFADVLRLADIQHVATGIDHAVDAGLRRRELGVPQNGIAAVRERTRVVFDRAAGQTGIVQIAEATARPLLQPPRVRIGFDVFFRNTHAVWLLRLRVGRAQARWHGRIWPSSFAPCGVTRTARFAFIGAKRNV